MNVELLQKVAASVGECTGISCDECCDAVLRVAIEACAEMCRKMGIEACSRLGELNVRHDESESMFQDGRASACNKLEEQIRALLTDAGATDAQPDAS